MKRVVIVRIGAVMFRMVSSLWIYSWFLVRDVSVFDWSTGKEKTVRV